MIFLFWLCALRAWYLNYGQVAELTVEVLRDAEEVASNILIELGSQGLLSMIVLIILDTSEIR